MSLLVIIFSFGILFNNYSEDLIISKGVPMALRTNDQRLTFPKQKFKDFSDISPSQDKLIFSRLEGHPNKLKQLQNRSEELHIRLRPRDLKLLNKTQDAK